MSKFNNDVIQALEIKTQYEAHNTKTREVASEYNPKTKCRYFKKVEIDPAALLFKKKFIKSKITKEKPINTKTEKRKPGRPVNSATTKKAKKGSISRVKKESLEKRRKIHKLALVGENVNAISHTVGLCNAQVYRHLKALNFDVSSLRKRIKL